MPKGRWWILKPHLCVPKIFFENKTKTLNSSRLQISVVSDLNLRAKQIKRTYYKARSWAQNWGRKLLDADKVVKISSEIKFTHGLASEITLKFKINGRSRLFLSVPRDGRFACIFLAWKLTCTTAIDAQPSETAGMHMDLQQFCVCFSEHGTVRTVTLRSSIFWALSIRPAVA